jgi:hypothetical protein
MNVSKKPKKAKSKERISVKDILIAATMSGSAGLDDIGAEDKVHLLRKAAEFCAQQGKGDIETVIVAYANARGLCLWPGRGRGVPVAGETRSYKTQQVGTDGDPFIRLPISALGVKKGDVVTVEFKADVISVRTV